MSLPTMAEARTIIQAICTRPADTVSYGILFEIFGLESQNDRSRLRSKLRDMIRRGELVRVRPGVFHYNPRAVDRPAAEGYQRVWRAVRAQRPGWTLHDLVQITRMGYAHVRKYCAWLHAEGYITHHGRTGNTYRWRATPKARARQQTPIPSRAPKDPFATERNAACRLVRCLMEADPYQPRIRQKVITECQTILRRFEPAKQEAKQ